MSEADWSDRADEWLPNAADRSHLASLMVGVQDPGQMASWIAPPASGIHQQPVDFRYVRP